MKILLATTRYPWPPRRGNLLRTVQMADWLAGEHELTLLAPAPSAGEPPPPPALPYRLELYRASAGSAALGIARAVFGGRPLQSGLYDQPELRHAIRHRIGEVDLAIAQLVRLASHLEEFDGVPLVVDLVDSLALNFERRAAFDRPGLRLLLRAEARRLRRWEMKMIESSRRAWVVCERDRRYLAEGLRAPAAARLAVLPPAVEGSAALAAVAPGSAQAPGAGPCLALTGNLGYFPTVEGIAWFLGEVWPGLRRRRPDLSLILAGARPAGAVRRAARTPGVVLLESPPDLRAVLASCAVALAPARCGSGVSMKILEAWACGVPVVAAPWSAAGAGAEGGKDLLAAGAAEEWEEAIVQLLEDEPLRARLIEGGRRRLTESFSPATVRATLLRQVNEASGI